MPGKLRLMTPLFVAKHVYVCKTKKCFEKGKVKLMIAVNEETKPIAEIVFKGKCCT